MPSGYNPIKHFFLQAFPVGESYSKLIKEHSRTWFWCLSCWVWTVICPLVLQANSSLASNISEYKWMQKILFSHLLIYHQNTFRFYNKGSWKPFWFQSIITFFCRRKPVQINIKNRVLCWICAELTWTWCFRPMFHLSTSWKH